MKRRSLRYSHGAGSVGGVGGRQHLLLVDCSLEEKGASKLLKLDTDNKHIQSATQTKLHTHTHICVYTIHELFLLNIYGALVEFKIKLPQSPIARHPAWC